MAKPSTPETKSFHIGDILTVTTGRLVSPRLVDGLYDILNWMTSDNLMTHQLPRASKDCAPVLRATFPDLAKIPAPTKIKSEAGALAWLAGLEPQYGTHRDVPKLGAGYMSRDPMLELLDMVGDKPIITI